MGPESFSQSEPGGASTLAAARFEKMMRLGRPCRNRDLHFRGFEERGRERGEKETTGCGDAEKVRGVERWEADDA